MALLALSYPTISENHWKWIQAIRAQHDPNYSMVAPHFTLIFPTFNRERAPFRDHLRRQLQGQRAISFTLRCALVVKDDFNDNTHTFLVPDEGFSDLVKLHDKLYGGFLADQLRLDIAYIPHITITTSHDAHLCKRIADEINQQGINGQELAIPGVIGIIEIVQLANKIVTTLEQLSLG
jgi:hypothetical protein